MDIVGLRWVTTGPLPATHPGYERARRHTTPPRKKFRRRTHTGRVRGDKAYDNLLVRGIYAPAERATSLLKTTFKALRLVSLDPSGITGITRAAFVLLHLEHQRPTPGTNVPHAT
jgi:hypothetical protein